MAGDPASLPLVQEGDISYEGAFLLYDAADGAERMRYGARALAVRPGSGSMFVSGHSVSLPDTVVEVSVPTLIDPATLSGANNFAIADQLNKVTISQANASTTGALPAENRIEGLLVYSNKLVIAGANPYEASDPSGAANRLSHYVRSSLTLNSGSVTSAEIKGAASGTYSQRRMFSGYMCHVPEEWQALLGGPVLTGFVAQSIVSRASDGPSAMVIDPDTIDSTNEVLQGVPLVGYGYTTPLDGGNPDYTIPDNPYFDTYWPRWNWRGTVAGCCIPPGTRTLLFFGTNGHGRLVYGAGTSVRADHTEPNGVGAQIFAYDPADNSNGEHSYPYRYQVWAYDLNDLLAVKAGTLQPHEVEPYDWWTFELPFEGTNTYNWETDTPNPDPAPDNHNLSGMTYDPATRRVYVSVDRGYYAGYSVVHALNVDIASIP